MDSVEVSVTVERTALGQYRVSNNRGGSLTLRTEATDFNAVELFLAGIGACTLIDVDHLTSRRAEPDSLSVRVRGDKISSDDGRLMDNVTVEFHASYPDGEAGDEARAMLPRAMAKSHDRLCTVSRTVEAATPVTMTIAGAKAES